jgi:hypothetical protein
MIRDLVDQSKRETTTMVTDKMVRFWIEQASWACKTGDKFLVMSRLCSALAAANSGDLAARGPVLRLISKVRALPV